MMDRYQSKIKELLNLENSLITGGEAEFGAYSDSSYAFFLLNGWPETKKHLWKSKVQNGKFLFKDIKNYQPKEIESMLAKIDILMKKLIRGVFRQEEILKIIYKDRNRNV